MPSPSGSPGANGRLSEQEGDKMRSGGEEDDRRTSLASSSQSRTSVDDRYDSPPVASGQGAGVVRQSSTGQDMPSTPNPSANQAGPYAQLGNSPTAHQMSGGGGGFRSPAAGPQDYPGYTLSPTVSVIHPSGRPSSIPGSGFHSVLDPYQQPRTTPPSIFVVTQGLTSRTGSQIPDNTPELFPPENSPYVSSASDSTYSTPASDISRGPRLQWMHPRLSPQPQDWPPQLLPSYPGATSRELSSAGDVMTVAASAPLFGNPFSSPHFPSAHQPHSFGNMLDVSMTSYPSADTHHPMLSPSSESTYRSHPGHHGNAAASVRSPTPPPNTSSHTTDTLVTPTPALPTRMGSMTGLGRQKEVAVEIAGEHHGLVGMDGLAGLGGTAFSSHASPGIGYGHMTLAALDLPMGGCGTPGPPMAIPLQ